MDENQLFSSYSELVDEVYGLNDYENIYYNAPQEPSYNWSDLYYCQTDLVYDPAFYVMPSYLVYYPVIPVLYSSDSYYLTAFVPVYSGYYMPYYYEPTNLYYVSDIYQVPAYETTWVSSSVEQNSLNYEEQDSDLYNTAFGFSEKSYESFTGGVGEVTCYLYQEERPEKFNDDPNDHEENTNSSINTVSNDVDSTTPDNNENTAVQLDEGGQQSSTNSNLCVEDDVTFLKSLSAADFTELKAEIDGTYNQLKENLYYDVTRGYTKMKEFLKNVKWKWDRCLYTIREEEKVKKSFDMDFEYYFHDVIRIPKGRVKYEDPAEKYILYQMLGSLQMDDLKRFMELNYNNGKERLYKKECIGHTKIKKQLKKLKWERSSLCRITEGKELKISKKAFVRNFIRGLRNITSEESKDVNYLLDVLKKSVLTPTPESEELQDVFTEEGIAADCQLMTEHPQLQVSSSDSVEDHIPDTPHIFLSNGDLDVQSQNIIEDFRLSVEDSKKDQVIHKIELSFCKEEGGADKIEKTSLFSLETEENECPFAPPVIEMDSVSDVSYIEEELISSTENSNLDVPLPDRVEENECPFAPPVIEMDSVPDVAFIEEELMSSTENSNHDVPLPDSVDEMKFPSPSAILEPEALAAVAENNHPKKRFSSLRKFLSRICCCRKRPPS